MNEQRTDRSVGQANLAASRHRLAESVKKIKHCSNDRVAEPAELSLIDNGTPLPSADQFSDHLAISANIALGR